MTRRKAKAAQRRWASEMSADLMRAQYCPHCAYRVDDLLECGETECPQCYEPISSTTCDCGV